jgi:glycosyltransferase involved in cell wall biosynthesis
VIVYCHSTFCEAINFVNTNGKGVMKLYHDLLKRRISKQISLLKKSNVKLIANSEFTRQKIKENLGKESLVIFPPVQIDKSNIKNRQKNGVITIARYSQEKNLEFAVNVMKSLPVNYTIIGNAKLDTQFAIFKQLSNEIKSNPNIKLLCNVKKDIVDQTLFSSKIYFHTSKETFGLSVVECIAAGCIPIVPNNSAHCETVPFSELRYEPNNIDNARKLVMKASNGHFEDLIPKLQEHIKIFNSNNFKKKMIELIGK